MKNRFLFFIFLFGFLSFSPGAFAGPAQLVIIRHAEKPAKGNALSARGQQRAQALVHFFKNDSHFKTYGEPIAIFAMPPPHGTGSIRAIQTVQPLARSLGLSLETSFEKDEIRGLVEAIRRTSAYDGHMVLICWEYKFIPAIAEAFGADMRSAVWSQQTYDRAWVLNLTDGMVTQFMDLPQNLLPGDSSL